MKKVLISVFLFSQFLLSQDNVRSTPKWGMEFGLNYNQIVSGNLDYHSKFLPSANLMVFYDIPSGKDNSFLVGLRLADNAVKLNYHQTIMTDPSPIETEYYNDTRDFHVLCLGANVRYIHRFVKVPFYFSGGVEIGFNLYPFQEYDPYAIEMSKILNLLNVSINLGTGYYFHLESFKGYIHLSYILGLSPVFNYDGEEEIREYQGLYKYQLSDDLKNRTIIINFGFYF